MSLLLQQIFGFFKLLNSETGHNQIATGIAFGLILGFSPALSIQSFLVFIIIFIFRIQIGAALISAFFFKFAGYIVDPWADHLGRWVLENPDLRPLFVEMYNLPLIPFTQFNNSIVMGSGVLAIVLSPLVFILSRVLILKYRKQIVEKFKSSKVWKAFAATAFYKWYNTYQSLSGQ